MSRRDDLEAAIDADPFDAATYAILGDELQRIGDPRGELVALQMAGHAAATTLLASNPALAPSGAVELAWRNGFVHRARVPEAQLAAVIDHPACRFLVELEVVATDVKIDATPVLATRPRPTLRSLELLVGGANRRVGDVAFLAEIAPRLGRLAIHGLATSLPMHLAHLERFEMVFPRQQPGVLRQISVAAWPSLVELALRGNGFSAGAVPDFANSTRLPKLVHLEITHANGMNRVIEPLADSPLGARLTTLRLSSSLDDDDAEALLRRREAFRALRVLDVARNRLTPRGIALLANFAETVRPRVADPIEEAEELRW